MRAIVIAAMCFLILACVTNAQSVPQSYLFVAEPQAIEGFSINSVTGAIVSTGPVTPDTNSPVAITTNSPATFLFSANANATISVFQIASTGILTEIANSPFNITDATQPGAIAVSNDGTTLYVALGISNANQASGQLDSFTISASGQLTESGNVSAPSQAGFPVLPASLIASATNLYLAAGSVVQSYTLNQNVPTASVATGLASGVVSQMAGNANFLFVARTPAESQNGSIDTLGINGDGSLSFVSTYDAGLFNPELNLALSEGYLFSNQNTYGIAANGNLTPNNLNWVNAPFVPLAASPTQPFLFEGDQAIGLGNGPLIFPFVVASNGEVSNAEPPLDLNGIPSEIIVAIGTAASTSAPAVVFEPASFNFSPVVVGQTSLAQLTIYSTGSVPLTISDISVTGSAFTEQSSTCPSSLAPSESCFVYINFEPPAAGTFTGSLNLTGNVSGTVPLSGTGTGTAPTQFTLQTSAVGPGTIQQAPSGTSFAAGTSIMLTAVPNLFALFTGWSGACAGSANAVCTFSLTANTTVTATFIPNPTVTASQPSQSGAPGSTFTFQINENGFTTKPTLTATCSIPKGGCSITGTTLTVTTAGSNAGFVPTYFPQAPLAPLLPPALILSGLLSITLLFSNPRARRILGATAIVGGFVILAGCGGSSGGGVNPNTGTPAGNYSVSIQAVAGTFTAGTTVTITVQ